MRIAGKENPEITKIIPARAFAWHDEPIWFMSSLCIEGHFARQMLQGELTLEGAYSGGFAGVGLRVFDDGD